ncbi:Dethiobiotin synthetase [Roseofilum sp. BLCC_M91]|uniref:Dethiobiotin synthetase n=1 Tax=Roseofilum halophilum BLCC-M91 TaxID=3022259 RepID=A0ABT7BEI0_9CYAN|nr:Dethiobiotin synthetase [Roseofilum halophilum]MDJ1177597.1 Dethiobiotin synthetase [Roseofilum halophilum BLCC-M91]
MDYKTACEFAIAQGLPTGENPDAFLLRLRAGEPPVPGQVTSLLLALSIIAEQSQEQQLLDRRLVCALHQLAMDSRQAFLEYKQSGVIWPPLLDQDLTRIAIAVRKVFIPKPAIALKPSK